MRALRPPLTSLERPDRMMDSLTLSRQPAIAAAALRWHRGVVVRGHGVASGQAPDSPYPQGTIALQRPCFAKLGLDLGDCYPGTINLSFPGGVWQLSEPAFQVTSLRWTDRHPPENFSFWPCRLRLETAAAEQAAWIYWPHPDTKARHFQDPDRLEILAPWIEGLQPGMAMELGVDGGRCHRAALG
jgi:hypothetical protein